MHFSIYPCIHLFLFVLDFIYLFLEREEGGERERETSMCGWLSHVPYEGPGSQPRHVPWLGIESATLWFKGRCSIHWATPARDTHSSLIHPCIHPCTHLPVYALYASVCLYTCSYTYIYLSAYISAHTSSIHSSVCVVIFPSVPIYASIRPSLSIGLSMSLRGRSFLNATSLTLALR